MKRRVVLMGMAALLSGCGALPNGLFGNRNRPEPLVDPTPPSADSDVPENARTVEEFDTTSADDRAAALEGAQSTSGEARLGTTIASLGDVTQSGIWLKTPLVSEAGKGRVVFAETGKAVAVDLIPLEGEASAGSRISLAAMRLLEVDLTSLPELQVFRTN